MRSVPSVKLVRCFYSFECPQIVSCQIHAFWISSAKPLSDPGIMKSLSISKLEVTYAKSQEKSEENSSCSACVVGIEIVLQVGGLVSVVHETEEGSEGAVSEGGSTS